MPCSRNTATWIPPSGPKCAGWTWWWRPRRPTFLPDELLRIVTLLPPGDYTRQRLCTQLNSAIAGHAWGQVYGTVE